MITKEQQLHLDVLYESSIKHIKENWDYGNSLMTLYFLYQDFYTLKNLHERLWKSHDELVGKYQKMLLDEFYKQ